MTLEYMAAATKEIKVNYSGLALSTQGRYNVIKSMESNVV